MQLLFFGAKGSWSPFPAGFVSGNFLNQLIDLGKVVLIISMCAPTSCTRHWPHTANAHLFNYLPGQSSQGSDCSFRPVLQFHTNPTLNMPRRSVGVLVATFPRVDERMCHLIWPGRQTERRRSCFECENEIVAVGAPLGHTFIRPREV